MWLTPVLTSDWVVDALRRASAPALLVGGTARLAASAAVLGQVATAVEDFLDEVVWP